MGLSCDCEYDAEPGDVCWSAPTDFKPHIGRAKCCRSCKATIKSGDLEIEFRRWKIPESEVEYRIYGEDGEIPRASAFFCEKCAGVYLSLDELGYCINIDDDMRELVKEYAETHTKSQAAE